MGVDIEAATAHPLRTMLKLDLIASSLGDRCLLLIYYVSVSVLTILLGGGVQPPAANADGINTWYWPATCPERSSCSASVRQAHVRKPFMLLGAVGTIVMTIVLIFRRTTADTGYYSNVVMVVLLGVLHRRAYSPWMAGYTERSRHTIRH